MITLECLEEVSFYLTQKKKKENQKENLQSPHNQPRPSFLTLLVLGLMLIYVLARGCLVVEMFASVRAQPLECY